MDKYTVRPLKDNKSFTVTVPGSKSITNRALLLAAMCGGTCTLNGVLFSDDSRAFLSCLKELGYRLDISESSKTVTIEGGGGSIPRRSVNISGSCLIQKDSNSRTSTDNAGDKRSCNAEKYDSDIPVLNVGSAGTAARFLTVFLAFAGGEYSLDASSQMRRRPMEPLISDLRNAGVTITCTGEEGHFPFVIKSNGIKISEMSSNTDVSSQFASAILMSAPLLKDGLRLKLEGSRTDGSYIGITLKMMSQFGFKYTRIGDTIEVQSGYSNGNPSGKKDNTKEQNNNREQNNTAELPGPGEVRKRSEQGVVQGQIWSINNPAYYEIEPDMSAACYFYAMSLICTKKMQVRGVHPDSMQGDYRFIKILEKLGCHAADAPEGIILTPPEGGSYPGIDINMKDYSDQTMTMAVTAAFASSPTAIHDVGHIRFQESDRLSAIVTELNRLGCKCTAIEDNTGLYIEPTEMHGAKIETYEDHRIAMAFSLAGLRIPGVTILNPLCCRKTFENYFDVLDSITV